MNLIVDIGNSRIKIAVIDLSRVIWSDVQDDFSRELIQGVVARFKIDRAIVCSTRGNARYVANEIERLVGECLLFDHTTPIPIGCCYSTPETLGRDRLAAAVGARAISTADNQLIIDFGTAITIDLVTEANGFEGGVISPGIMMRFRALNEFTASLPKYSPTEEFVEVASSTREAIEQGVMRGVEYELMGHIGKMREKFDEIDIIFTGGDAKYFDKRIKNTIFAPSELIFVGLNRILEYNAE